MFELRVKFARHLFVKADGLIEEVLVDFRLKIHRLIRVSARVLEKPSGDAQHGFRFVGTEFGKCRDHLGWVQPDLNSLSFGELAKDLMSGHS